MSFHFFFANKGDFLLDKIRPIFAISTSRKLSSNASYAMRIRRASDDAELDVGFAGNSINNKAIKDFGGYNLLGYTEDFNNSIWNKSSSITVNPSTQQNPIDGGASVFLLKNPTLDTNKKFVSQHVNGQRISGFGIISGYFKSDGGHVQLRAFGVGNQGIFANFDLTNGTIGTVGSNVISATIEASENGFYHCKLFVNHNNPYTAGYVLIDNVNSGEFPIISTPNIGFFIYGTQIIQGSTSLPYQPRLQGGASDCFVTTCYGVAEQNATQTTKASQPKIYDVASGDLTKENGNPAMVFDGVDDSLGIPNSQSLVNGLHKHNEFGELFGLFAPDTVQNTANAGVFSNVTGTLTIGYSTIYRYSGNSFIRSIIGDGVIGQHVIITNDFTSNDGAQKLYNATVAETFSEKTNNVNGITNVAYNNPRSSSDATYDFRIGANGASGDNYKGTIQELMIFNKNLTTKERTLLHSDINNHFNIY